VAELEATSASRREELKKVVDENAGLLHELANLAGAMHESVAATASGDVGPRVATVGQDADGSSVGMGSSDNRGGGWRQQHQLVSGTTASTANTDARALSERLALTERELDLLLQQHDRLRVETAHLTNAHASAVAEANELGAALETTTRELEASRVAVEELEKAGDRLSEARIGLKGRLDAETARSNALEQA